MENIVIDSNPEAIITLSGLKLTSHKLNNIVYLSFNIYYVHTVVMVCVCVFACIDTTYSDILQTLLHELLSIIDIYYIILIYDLCTRENHEI